MTPVGKYHWIHDAVIPHTTWDGVNLLVDGRAMVGRRANNSSGLGRLWREVEILTADNDVCERSIFNA